MITNEFRITMSDGHIYKITEGKTAEDAVILASADAIRLQRSRKVRKMEQVSIPKGEVLFEKVGIFVIYDEGTF